MSSWNVFYFAFGAVVGVVIEAQVVAHIRANETGRVTARGLDWIEIDYGLKWKPFTDDDYSDWRRQEYKSGRRDCVFDFGSKWCNEHPDWQHY